MKRYDIEYSYGGCIPVEDKRGEWVEAEIALELLKALEDLLLDMKHRVRDSETMTKCEEVIAKAKGQDND